MGKLAVNLSSLFVIPVIIFLVGCAGGNLGELRRVEKPTENELVADWQEYSVYYRNKLALVYKIKDDRKVILDNRWVAVSSEDMLAKSEIIDLVEVKEIIGNNEEIFGYLVHRYQDIASIKIIDENTLQLYYHYQYNRTPLR